MNLKPPTKVTLRREGGNFHMKAGNQSGITVDIDNAPASGGENKGARPMELLLMGLGGCSAMDIIGILKKQKQNLRDFSIDVDGHRDADEIPSVYKQIKVTFHLDGDLDEAKAKRAVGLSMEKYCSVSHMLARTAGIRYAIVLNGTEIEEKELVIENGISAQK